MNWQEIDRGGTSARRREDWLEPAAPRLAVERVRAPPAVAGTIEVLRRKGLARLLVDGRAVGLDEVNPAHSRLRNLEVVRRSRIQLGDEDPRQRLTDSIETAYLEGGGAAWAVEHAPRTVEEAATVHRCFRALRVPALRHRLRRSAAAAVLVQQPVRRVPDLPRLRQHHRARHGPGRARSDEVDYPGRDRAVEQAALSRATRRPEDGAAKKAKLRLDVPWAELTDDEQPLRRSKAATISTASGDSSAGSSARNTRSTSASSSAAIAATSTCPDCGGARLRREARDVRVAGRTIDQVSALTVREAQGFFGDLAADARRKTTIAEKVLKEIRRRLSFLSDVGLDYLHARSAVVDAVRRRGAAHQPRDLAGLGAGRHAVRPRRAVDRPALARQPPADRHPSTSCAIRATPCSVVEHDADMIRVADHIVDLGLGAGEQGGRVVFSGTLDGLMHEPRSLTSKLLAPGAGDSGADVATAGHGPEDQAGSARPSTTSKNVDVAIPLNTLTCVTGVSGSGQVHAGPRRPVRGDQARQGRLGQARRARSERSKAPSSSPTPCSSTRRRSAARRGPIRSLISRPFDPIRELFAATKDARSRGLTASHFSFNVPGGRCEACQGEGEVRVEMQFLADVFVPVRPVRRQALQAAGARGPLSRPLDPSGARPDRPRSADVLRQLAEGAAAAAGARRDRPRLPAPRPASDDAVGRRGAADQDCGALCRRTAASACSTSSTSRRPGCTSTTSPSC